MAVQRSTAGTMAFFRSIQLSETHPIVPGDGVFLRAPQMADFSSWAALAREKPRVPLAMGTHLAGGRPDALLVPPPACGAIPRICRGDQAYAFLLFRKDDERSSAASR